MCCFCNSLEKQIKKVEEKLVKLENIKFIMKKKIKDLSEELLSIEQVENDLTKKLVKLKLERE